MLPRIRSLQWKQTVKKKLYFNDRLVGEYEFDGEAGSPGDLEAAQARLAELGIKPTATPPMAARILGQAFAFAQSAHLNFDRLNGKRGLDGAPQRDPNAFAPFVVNASFALELYLKALAEAHGTRIKKVHDLDALFNKLPEAARARLRQSVQEVLAARAVQGFTDLPQAFGAMRKSFVEWRYLYERDQTDMFPVQVATMLMGVLHDLCLASISGSRE